MIHDEFEGLVGRINDERIPVVATHDYGVFNTQVIIGELFLLPLDSILWLRQEFCVRQGRAQLESYHVN